MGRDHHALGRFGIAREFTCAMHAEDIPIDTEDEDVAVIGAYLNPSKDEEVVLGAELFHGLHIPDGVVLGEADSIQPGLLGANHKVFGVQDTIVRTGPRVGVKVNQHVGSKGLYPCRS